jgi:hypothetical protein
MDIRLTKQELEILAYMHEHAEGFGALDAVPDESICAALGCSKAELRKSQTYLAYWGLVALAETNVADQSACYLTGAGENLMRHFEEELRQKEPGLKGTGLSLLKGAGTAAYEVAIQTASALLAACVQQRLFV